MAKITQAGPGRAGMGAVSTAAFGLVLTDGTYSRKPGSGVIDGSDSRDPGNTPNIDILRCGLLMARNATTPYQYAPWCNGVTTAAITGASTTINVSAAYATEIVRNIGSTGTFVLTGPSTAGTTALTNNAARQKTVTYSAVNTSTGDITVTALGAVNQSERIRFNIASSGGNLQLTVQKTDGTFVTTANAAWSATDATYLGAINSALDTATGVVGGIVASASAGIDTDIELVLTYSGTGYAGKPWTPAVVAVLPTSSTSYSVQQLKTADGSFIAGSVISKAAYAVPETFVVDTQGVQVRNDGTTFYDTDWANVPDAGKVTFSALLPTVTDSELTAWIKAKLKLAGVYTFN